MRHPVIKASHTQKVGDFHLYSNTSDDALGLSGALADIGSTLSQAKQAILITGWKFSPELHLLFFHEQLREALIAHEKKELDQAEEQYHAVTEHFSETSLEYCYAHYFLAVIQMETGRLDEAEASLKRCLAVQPHNPQFFNAQLAILLTQGKLAEAEEKAMLQANTPYTNANFFALYGDILAKNINSYRGAEENYLRALEQDSACILALRGLGKLYALQGKTKEAIEKFSFLLKFFPADPDANLQLAKIFYEIKSLDEAKKHSDLALRGGLRTAEALTLRVKIAIFAGFFDTNDFKQNTALLIEAKEKDQGSFLLQYQKALILHKKLNNIAEAKKSLLLCAMIDPVALKERLILDNWPPLGSEDALALENKIAHFNATIADHESIDQKIAFYEKRIVEFPSDRDAFFALAELYEKMGDPKNAFACYCRAENLEPYDRAYLQQVIVRMEALSLEDPADSQNRRDEIAALYAFIQKEKNYSDFYSNYSECREQLPSLAELLIQKAVENRGMVVALQLWNRVGLSDMTYYENIDRSFKQAHQKLYPGAQFPENLLLRFTNCQSAGFSHHQKYCIVDTGDKENPSVVAFCGSMDLACGKFDWADHPVSNTVENAGARSRAHIFNRGENYRQERDSHLLLPWRETLSRATGPIAADFVDVFKERWLAAGHQTRRGLKGDENLSRVAAYANDLQESMMARDFTEDTQGYFVSKEKQIEDDADYPWQGQVLLSTKKDYTSGNVGFYKQSQSDKESSIKEAMLSAIAKAENYIYIETQYLTDASIIKAIAEKIKERDEKNAPFHVYIVLPFSPNGDPGGKVFVEPVRQTQWALLQDCMRSIESDTKKPWNTYLSPLFFAQWEGVDAELAELHHDGKAHSRSALLNHSYRLPVYIHSKLMVIDDSVVFTGSANLNERSLSGDMDTELVVMQTPRAGHETECREKVATFMREKIIRPYFGSATTAVLEGEVSLDLSHETIISNKTIIKSGRLENIILRDHGRMDYRIEKENGEIIASLHTTPSELYKIFLGMLGNKNSYVVNSIESTQKKDAEKLVLLIEYVRSKKPELVVVKAFSEAYYKLFKEQLVRDNDSTAMAQLKILSSHFGTFHDYSYADAAEKNVALFFEAGHQPVKLPFDISAAELWRTFSFKYKPENDTVKFLKQFDTGFFKSDISNEEKLQKLMLCSHASVRVAYQAACFSCYEKRIVAALLLAVTKEEKEALITLLQQCADQCGVSMPDLNTDDMSLMHGFGGNFAAEFSTTLVSNALHLGSPEVVAQIQEVALANLHEFSSNEPGHVSTPENGKVVTFPLVMNQCGRVGELLYGHEFIPDAPINENGNQHPAFRWIPRDERSLVLKAANAIGYRGIK